MPSALFTSSTGRSRLRPGGDGVVERGRAFAANHHEQHQVGFLGGGGIGVLRMARRSCRGGSLLPAMAGIDQRYGRSGIEPALAVVAVAGDAGRVVDNASRLPVSVEQRRFSDVGTTDRATKRSRQLWMGDSGMGDSKNRVLGISKSRGFSQKRGLSRIPNAESRSRLFTAGARR